MDNESEVLLDFEVRKRSKSKEPNDEIAENVKLFLQYNSHLVPTIQPNHFKTASNPNTRVREYLYANVSEITVCDETEDVGEDFSVGNIFVYELSRSERDEELLENDEEDIAACQIWNLPCRDFHSLWESLHMKSNIKIDLLNFPRSSLFFAEHGINKHLISWNKVILLHGPPGTGKTSLCKGLAQKLAIRLVPSRFEQAMLLEINAHSLFSKYFSESGKLVMKMFQRIKEYLDNAGVLVMLLIDEVESLTAARSTSKDEPSDAVRVVNALLTQLDQIKEYPNALILTTSNVTGRIDLAFVDRADLKIFIDLPGPSAIYDILKTSVDELMRGGIIVDEKQLRYAGEMVVGDESEHESSLIATSKKAQGLSGRALRKLPFLAHVKHIKTPNGKCSLRQYLSAISKMVQSELSDRNDLEKQVNL